MAGDAHIRVIEGPGSGQCLEVRLGDRASIGREQPAGLVIRDDTVSKKHVELENKLDGLWVVVVGKNGATLDGRKVPRDGVRVISDSKLKVGASLIQITLDAPPKPPPGLVFERWLGRGETG